MELEAKHLKKPHSEQKLPEVNPMPKNPLGKLLSQKAVVPPTKQVKILLRRSRRTSSLRRRFGKMLRGRTRRGSSSGTPTLSVS